MSSDDQPDTPSWQWPPPEDQEDAEANDDGVDGVDGVDVEVGAAPMKGFAAPESGRRTQVIAGAAIVLGLSAAALAYTWSARASEPFQHRQAARAALNEARGAGADRWAPSRLGATEDRFEAALGEEQQQRARFLLARNYDSVRDNFDAVVSLAGETVEMAGRAQGEARSAAERAIARTAETVGTLDRADGIRLELEDRTLLQLARLGLREAEIRNREGDYEGALGAASEASQRADEVVVRLAVHTQRFVDQSQIGLWERWIEETIDWSRTNSAAAILVNKEKNLVTLIDEGSSVRTYHGDMGRNNLAFKTRSGDEATPEGRYKVLQKRDIGQTQFYKALLLDYPNEADRRRFAEAKEAGILPADAQPGGLIEIHGDGGRGEDWTLGCVALSNDEMDDLFARVRVGTPVTIVGGDGTGGAFSNLFEDLGGGR